MEDYERRRNGANSKNRSRRSLTLSGIPAVQQMEIQIQMRTQIRIQILITNNEEVNIAPCN